MMNFRKVLRHAAMMAFMAMALAAGMSPAFAEAVIPERPEEYVRDEAGALSDREIKGLNDMLGEYSQKKKNRIDILLVKTTDGEPINSYAKRAMSQWRTGVVGHEQEPDAVIVAATSDRKATITAGDGMKKSMTESELSGILGKKEVKSSIRDGDWSAAMCKAVVQIQRADKRRSSAEKEKKKHLATSDINDELVRIIDIVFPVAGIMMVLAIIVHMLTGGDMGEFCDGMLRSVLGAALTFLMAVCLAGVLTLAVRMLS